MTYYGTHTYFDEVDCYLDGIIENDKKSINSILCFRDDGYWTVKFLKFSPKDIEPLLNILNEKSFST